MLGAKKFFAAIIIRRWLRKISQLVSKKGQEHVCSDQGDVRGVCGVVCGIRYDLSALFGGRSFLHADAWLGRFFGGLCGWLSGLVFWCRIRDEGVGGVGMKRSRRSWGDIASIVAIGVFGTVLFATVTLGVIGIIEDVIASFG